jgi:hypothetical protein
MKKLFALVSILIVVSASCRPKGGMDANTGYFSITALRDSLTKGKPVLKFNKTLFVEGKSETQTITDSLHLQIAFFEHFEINKPAYRGAYAVDTITSTPDSSGICIDEKYTKNEEFKFPVIYFSHSKCQNGHTYITAKSIESNLLTTITKTLNIEADNNRFLSYSYEIHETLNGGAPSSTIIMLKLAE